MRAWIPACVGLAAASLLVHANPSYDPWAWIVWGREIVELDLDLDTTGGPSWKPLPVGFTTVFALFGDAAPELWLVVARACALLALVLAYRVAARLGGRLAGVVAAIGLALSFGYVRYLRHGASEGMLVALVLWGVERHLDGRRDHALALGFLAALLRPEVWPFLGLYGLWLWLRERRLRPWLAAYAVLVPALWILPEVVGSGEALRASTRALSPEANSPAFAEQPARVVLGRAVRMVAAPVALAAVVATVLALVALVTRRRERAVVVLAFGTVGWTVLVAAMTEAGYAGNPRYLVPAAGLASVLGGVGVSRLADAAAGAGRRWAEGRSAGGGRRTNGGAAARQRAGGVARASTVALCLGLAAPALLGGLRGAAEQAIGLRAESDRYAALAAAVASAGGPGRLTGCGRVYAGLYQAPAVAWQLGLHVGEVGVSPRPPGVVFRTFPDDGGSPEPAMPAGAPAFRPVARVPGWQVFAACRSDGGRTRRVGPGTVGPPAGAFALGARLEVRQPDRRHQIAAGEHGQHPRVDAIGLAGQRRQPLDLLRVADLDLPAAALERVVHEARAVHRLDRRRDGDRVVTHLHAAGKAAQAVAIRWGRADLDALTPLVEQAEAKPRAAQIQSSVQHETGLLRTRSLDDTPERGTAGGPP